MANTPEIKLEGPLGALVRACEKACLADCCGIDAFDFSPLHIASHLSSHTGVISSSDLRELNSQLSEISSRVATIEPDEHERVCSLEGMNQYFTRPDLEALVALLRRNLALAPKVLAYSDSLSPREEQPTPDGEDPAAGV